MRKKRHTLVWLALALAALGWLIYRLPRGQFQLALQNLDYAWVVGGTLVYIVTQGLLAVRWRLLLTVHQVHISVGKSIQLTFLGVFYNNFMPGAVGGDILKAWYIGQHCSKGRRLEAAVTVFVDRVVGLMSIALVGAVASLFIGPELAFRGVQFRWIIWGLFGAMGLLIIVFLSRRVRRVLLVGRIIKRLPLLDLLRRVDDAIQLYRGHGGVIFSALLLTVVLQGAAVGSVWMLARGLHFEQVRFVQVLIIMPIIWTISSAIPVPGGLGIVEGMVIYGFAMVINPNDPLSDVARGSAGALALLYRLMLYAASVPGGLVPVFGGHLPKRSELELQAEALLKDDERAKAKIDHFEGS
ncbi:MAG: flippase-like domain-containing protein [Sedimentisphaerales bacterium]|nr:flippase-like domain-containing protein [Sedimentisphaerales bacterium]